MSSGKIKAHEKQGVNPRGSFATVGRVQTDAPTIAGSAVAATSPSRGHWLGLRPLEWGLMLLLSGGVLLASYRAWWSITVTEAWGFATGGVCVWLVVREHLWNWPIGIANNVFFFILFLEGRLYADMTLQVVYLGLGVYGWRNWVYGGQSHTRLNISRTTKTEWWALLAGVILSTWVMHGILIRVNDAAPFWDALTTVLSLAAQYLLCRKRFENWWFWIAADLIYVPLYFSRHLPLTGVLYGVFLIMCLIGLKEWRKTLRKGAVNA